MDTRRRRHCAAGLTAIWFFMVRGGRRWAQNWLIVFVVVLGLGAVAGCRGASGPTSGVVDAELSPSPTAVATTSPVVVPDPDPVDVLRSPTPSEVPVEGSQFWVDTATIGEPYGVTDGLLTFRGNPTRTFYGTGPIPMQPTVQWRFGGGDELCSFSSVGGETSKWCGTGWTGQPAIVDTEWGRWVIVGSFAPAVHFLDATTGERARADLVVDDLIKGSVTVDPDGFPLVYFGSRDGYFRIVSFDQPSPVELWRLGADDVEPTLWNDDWDGTALVIDDHLFVGGENSNLHIVRLNRRTGDDGIVTVDPQLIFSAPGWDDELLDVLLDTNVSIETAITITGNTLWFANSGGLVQAWDIAGLRLDPATEPERIFRFWTGDDTDASIVVDDEGYVYVGVEIERGFTRGVELGQLIKLDPRRPDDPVVWSRDLKVRVPDGVWATPALHDDVLYVPTNEGNLHAIDRATGATRWQVKLQGPVWSSPVVVDDVLLQADCAGILHAWDVSDTAREPRPLWTITLPWCIESTPAVWEGQIVVGHRRGEIWSIGEG